MSSILLIHMLTLAYSGLGQWSKVKSQESKGNSQQSTVNSQELRIKRKEKKSLADSGPLWLTLANCCRLLISLAHSDWMLLFWLTLAETG